MDQGMTEKIKKVVSIQEGYQQAVQNITKTDPFVLMTLDGKEYKLQFRFSEVRKLFKLTGKNLNAGELVMEDFQQFDVLAAALLIGLQRNHSALSQDILDEQLDMRYRLYYLHCIQQAIEATQPSLEFIKKLTDEMKDFDSAAAAEGLSTAPLEVTLPLPTSGPTAEA